MQPSDSGHTAGELLGRWRLRDEVPSLTEVGRAFAGAPPMRCLTFETTNLTGWDSGLVTVLLDLMALGAQHRLADDCTIMSVTPIGHDSTNTLRRDLRRRRLEETIMIRDKRIGWALPIAVGVCLAAASFQDAQRAPQAARKTAAPRDRPVVMEARPGLEPRRSTS